MKRRNSNRHHHPRPLPPIKRDRHLFFGWTNIKWFAIEIGNIYSEKPSRFSKKRIESGIAFIIGQSGMILFLLEKYAGLSMTDFIMWASLEFAVGGFITYQIQRQRRNDYRDRSEYENNSMDDCDKSYIDGHDNIDSGFPKRDRKTTNEPM